MATTSRQFSRRQTLQDVGKGFLQAVGILPWDKLPKGAYWARKQSTGEWELLYPAYTWDHPPT